MHGKCASLQVSVSVAGALERVVHRCLGPEGGSVLFTRDTGETLIHRHGQRILSTLHLEHPVARMVLDCVSAHARVTGDGTKSFILLLAALLRGIQNRRGSRTSAGLRNLANRLLAVSRNELDHVITHKITPYASFCCSCHNEKPEGRVLDLLIGGFISGRLPIGQRDTLRCVLCEFYTKVSEGQDAVEAVSFIESNFSCLHTPVTGLPIGSSEVIEGLVLSCDWSVWNEPQGPVKALIIYESFGPFYGDAGDGTSVRVQQDWLRLTESIMKQKLASLLDLQVHVVLSSVKQPESVLQWARLNHVCVIECVDSTQLDFIANICATETLPHPPLQHLVMLKHCRRVQLGGRRYAHLGMFSHTHTLVLCAPTLGLLEPVVRVCQGVFAMLKHASRAQGTRLLSAQDTWAEMVHSGGVLPVGGAFEFSLHHFLLKESSYDTSCRLLAEAVLCVPRTLYCHNHRHFLKQHTCFLSDLKHWDGSVHEASEMPELKFEFSECLESVSSKHQLVVSVLQCLHRLLCVEDILHTRSPLHTGTQTHSGEDDEEEMQEIPQHSNRCAI